VGKLRKIAKKIGRGIKKVVNKVGRAFGKLGIVGQLGMMFLMPYAMSGLSSLWSSTVGKAFGQFATQGLAQGTTTFASRLVAEGGLKGVIGQAMGAIHSAGSAIGSAYSSISTAISNGFDRAGNFLQGKGFTLSEGRTPVFGSGAEDIIKESAAEQTALEEYVKREGVSLNQVGKELDTGKILGIEDKAITDVITENKSLLEKGKDFVSQSYDSMVKDLTDPSKFGKKAAQTAFAHLQTALAPQMPEQTLNIVRPLDIGTIDAFNSQGIFNQADFTTMDNAYQSVGSVWGATSQLGQSYLMDQASMGSTNYINDMRRLQGYGGNS